MDGDREIEVLFPLAGINVSTEYGRQPKDTTPVGVNVRAFEVLAKRGRGGSRPGLTRYIASQLPSGHHVVQHLTVVVDPQEPGLLTDNSIDGDDPYPEVLDTSTNNNAAGYGDRNPGRFVRSGGSGKPQNRHPKQFWQTFETILFGDGILYLSHVGLETFTIELRKSAPFGPSSASDGFMFVSAGVYDAVAVLSNPVHIRALLTARAPAFGSPAYDGTMVTLS